VTHYLRGYYARQDGYYPPGGNPNLGSFAPMYTYAQIVHGSNTGTSFGDNLNIQQSQGIDPRAAYSQGDANFTSQPSAAEIANAANAKIAGYEIVQGPAGFFGSSLRGYIETKLASGNPVALSFPVYPEFANADSTHFFVTNPLPGETSVGGHAVAAFKYDANGVWIENSWGTGFGINGWAELSWDFLNKYAQEAVSIKPLSALTRYFNGGTTTHWVTTNTSEVSAGYHPEARLGYLFRAPQGGTSALYDCLASATSKDHFLSPDSGCEGRVRLGIAGYLYSGWQLFTPTVQVYRCYRTVNGHGDHFVSPDSHCEGYTTEASLGYLQS
jgi:hypothetical protein